MKSASKEFLGFLLMAIGLLLIVIVIAFSVEPLIVLSLLLFQDFIDFLTITLWIPFSIFASQNPVLVVVISIIISLIVGIGLIVVGGYVWIVKGPKLTNFKVNNRWKKNRGSGDFSITHNTFSYSHEILRSY